MRIPAALPRRGSPHYISSAAVTPVEALMRVSKLIDGQMDRPEVGVRPLRDTYRRSIARRDGPTHFGIVVKYLRDDLGKQLVKCLRPSAGPIPVPVIVQIGRDGLTEARKLLETPGHEGVSTGAATW